MVQKYNLLVICLRLTYVIFYKVLCSPCCLLIVILLCYLVHPSLVLLQQMNVVRKMAQVI
jgi:hypothetical protein